MKHVLMKYLSRLPLGQEWYDAYQDRKSHREYLQLLEAEFYATLMVQPAVRAAIAQLHEDAVDLAYGYRRYYRVPAATRLFVRLDAYLTQRNDVHGDEVHRAVHFFFQQRAGDKQERWVMLLWGVLGLLGLLFGQR